MGKYFTFAGKSLPIPRLFGVSAALRRGRLQANKFFYVKNLDKLAKMV